ncbi:MAG: cob(I)yrinic acid a,c-diamide adenosyltransferase [Candidatus Peribacteraceae bacterium]|jgi:cob(I)alamin adenosyltransferase|nr:cob(I)yrinic acid a,c-diamide adenosyltransferase [Candidatus Peribacteraceae bacterium]MDP7454257.1 cob(I)yrinic acid a,c-diamide adenosyltransferase [Candidatus Peribacteraceae bacterium]MDP7645747.1 cob(I)yrinic acid a,c-diamide adenosyltransferase [Candidatus Peribacteraceae bacterium]|tara:strand:+ start:86 stop:610 length:525 start_codon:yes stop_codon:yes gene_type:complete
MSVTTRTGDGGYSRLLTGERVSKGCFRLEAYGTVDELNAVIGVVMAEDGSDKFPLGDLQKLLFLIGSDLATPEDSQVNIKRVSPDDVKIIDEWIAELESALPELKRFILPSGSKLGSFLHLARTVCRRAERCTVRLSEKEKINEQIHIFLNRLSDYLFLCARQANRVEGSETEI